MLPIIIFAAAALLVGCSRSEEAGPAPSDPPPPPPPPPSSGRRDGRPGLWGTPHSVGRPAEAHAAETIPACNVSAPRPERFVIQDARQEFCRLHELLRGGVCAVEGNRVTLSETRTMTSVFSLIPNLRETTDFSVVRRHAELRGKLNQLEGVQMYLYSGEPCAFDGLQDLMDLMESYTLYRAAFNGSNAELRRAFPEGRVGCILRRGIHAESGPHHHEINGVSVSHAASSHDAILTPATLILEGLPADTPVSDCLVVR